MHRKTGTEGKHFYYSITVVHNYTTTAFTQHNCIALECHGFDPNTLLLHHHFCCRMARADVTRCNFSVRSDLKVLPLVGIVARALR